MEKIKSVQIFYNKDKEGVGNIISHLKKVFKKNAIDVILSGEIESPDIIIAIGGDGTLLKTAYKIKSKGIPVMGINMGSLGFLTEVPVPEIDSAMEKLFKGKYRIEKRTVLRMDCENKTDYALNDHVIYQTPDMRMVSLDVYVDKAFLTNVFADGLIVSSPTGSTAYSMSVGGPILTPGSENFVIAPIASHNLTVRPIVIQDNSEIRIRIEGREEKYLLSLDSRQHHINKTEEIIINKCNFRINLVQMPEQSFFSTIREKLLWGVDSRN